MEVDILSKQLAREKKARKEAETIAEEKSRVLYQANAILHNLTQDLLEKEKRTHAILESTADGIIVLNKNYEIELCNDAACQIFDYTSEELVGKKIHLVMKDIQNDENLELNKSVNEKTGNILREVIGLRKDKTTLPLELAISKIKLTEDLMIIFSFRNVAERKKIEQFLAVRHKIVRLMAEHTTLDEITEKILQIMCETMLLEEGGLWKVDDINNQLRCVAIWNKPEDKLNEFANISRQFKFTSGLGLPGRVWKNKSISWIQDISTDTNFPRIEWAKNAGLRSAFALPVFFENEVVGVFEFFAKYLYPFDDHLISMLTEISNELGIFIEREKAQSKAAILSRMVGMAEVASSVLHNVGNVLNSINVSVSLVDQKIKHFNLGELQKIGILLEQHVNDLVNFLIKDPRGKYVPKYLIELVRYWENEQETIRQELNFLNENVQRINSIIKSQQTMSGIFGTTEVVSLAKLLDDAITITITKSKYANVVIQRNYANLPLVILDKVKLMQIMVNLLSNAYESVMMRNSAEKKLILQTQFDNENIYIHVIDNGVGVEQKNMAKIFSSGFTTKKEGHGYGLHSSALASKEMGGSLIAYSDGVDKGAKFTVTLPLKKQKSD